MRLLIFHADTTNVTQIRAFMVLGVFGRTNQMLLSIQDKSKHPEAIYLLAMKRKGVRSESSNSSDLRKLSTSAVQPQIFHLKHLLVVHWFMLNWIMIYGKTVFL